MKNKDIFVFIGFFLILFLIPSNYSLQFNLNAQNGYFFQSLSLSDIGVSKYNISQTVTYQIETNFSLTPTYTPGEFYFKFARLNNRIPDSPLTKFCPPYQESELLYNYIAGYNPSEINTGHHDKFNNTYDSFNASLSPGEEITFNQKYTVKLNKIEFQDINDEDIGDYDTSDEIFDLYCNNSEPYYERDDPTLIDLSNSIVSYDDNPIEKARKIIEWVSNNLTYNGNLPFQEKGALWAYNNREGDCSEYSSLMITLLRIQNIPARKVTGFLISNNSLFEPKINDIYQFHLNDSSSTMMLQAWVEYYVPDIGWIACDPTWHNKLNYFNRIDVLRFHWNVGAHFFVPPSLTVSEFANPMFAFSIISNPQFSYDIKVIVINTSIPVITINTPTENQIFGITSPDYNLSITGAYNDIWYTIDNGITNIPASGLNGTIDQIEWDKKENEEITIKFYANNSAGLIGSKDVQVVKLVAVEEPPIIPGYMLIALIGISLITVKLRIVYINKNK